MCIEEWARVKLSKNMQMVPSKKFVHKTFESVRLTQFIYKIHIMWKRKEKKEWKLKMYVYNYIGYINVCHSLQIKMYGHFKIRQILSKCNLFYFRMVFIIRAVSVWRLYYILSRIITMRARVFW